jgi:hypothetical protein
VGARIWRDGCAVGAALVVIAAVGVGWTAASSVANVDVSNAPGPQNEPAIAIDPRNPNVLLAGSNSFSEKTERVYSSSDGGRTWQSRPGPPLVPGRRCGAADPGVGIDERGRQYFSFIQCTGPGRSRAVVASRSGPGGLWRSVPVPGAFPADKPALAVDDGRVYVVWIAHLRDGLRLVRLSTSRDGGRTWSQPVQVNENETIVFYPSVAVGRGGVVYVAWNEVGGIALARSLDHGKHFQAQVSIAAVVLISRCGLPIPAQPTTCVWPNPQLSADRQRGGVYITWSALGGNGALDVFALPLAVAPCK